MKTLTTLFLKRGENQQRKKPILGVGPDKGNTAKTPGKDWTRLLEPNLPLLHVFFRSARRSRNYHITKKIKEIRHLGVCNLDQRQ